MKYMTFNSSCSYAGIANMLEQYGFDTEDYQIALEMKLPYLFVYEEGVYLAGPSLQSARWFNLFLKPHGFELTEKAVPREQVCTYLEGQKCAMLGIHVSENSKHAVIYTRKDGDRYFFINNRHQQSPEPESFVFSETELLEKLDETVVVGTLNRCEAEKINYQPLFLASLETVDKLWQEIQTVCGQEKEPQKLISLLNPLFRPFLLDGISMLMLLGEDELCAEFTHIQQLFLKALRSGKTAVRLSDELPMERFEDAVGRYRGLIYGYLSQFYGKKA